MKTASFRSRFASPKLDPRAWVLAVLVAVAGCASARVPEAPKTPAELYGELFRDVQTKRVFPDSKTFVDAVPKRDPAGIVASYLRERAAPSFDLKAFVAREFTVLVPSGSEYHTVAGQDVRQHIDQLWAVLTRSPVKAASFSSSLPLPYRYVVPGGRFNEMYYWDSYFTMVGLQASGEHQLVREMCDNFAWLVERYGHIPNGTRTYYLSRSQPPFFSAMVELQATHEGAGAYARYREALQKEYDFWMAGAEQVQPKQAHRRVVRLADGTALNRYWDDSATPREESYREDVATAAGAARPREEAYRNLRAAAESGWDFSSRWFADGKTLATIRTVDMIPVDLNSLLYQLETTLSRAYEMTPNETAAPAMNTRSLAAEFKRRAAVRKAAVHKYLWNAKVGAFTDYLWREGHANDEVTAAAAAPLFFGLATADQAAGVANAVRTHLLRAHGLVSAPKDTGEQWDAPNGWAPLQWIAIEGLRRYQQDELADTIAQRWIKQNLAVFRATGKLVEKYDVTAAGTGAAGGGEYPLQDGFGWTNGVLRALLLRYPALGESSR